MKKKWRTVTEADVDALQQALQGVRDICTKQAARGLAAIQQRDVLLAQGRTDEAERFLVAEYAGMMIAMSSLGAGVEAAAWKVLGERRRPKESGAAYVNRLAEITGTAAALLGTMHRNRIRIGIDEEGA